MTNVSFSLSLTLMTNVSFILTLMTNLATPPNAVRPVIPGQVALGSGSP
jgi:hypothetical protein